MAQFYLNSGAIALHFNSVLVEQMVGQTLFSEWCLMPCLLSTCGYFSKSDCIHQLVLMAHPINANVRDLSR